MDRVNVQFYDKRLVDERAQCLRVDVLDIAWRLSAASAMYACGISTISSRFARAVSLFILVKSSQDTRIASVPMRYVSLSASVNGRTGTENRRGVLSARIRAVPADTRNAAGIYTHLYGDLVCSIARSPSFTDISSPAAAT